jgi:MerR family transcriptional regulator, redox-sensitive transcriptional activator SoxR
MASTSSGILIGAIARQAGLAPSAIRYYEKAGLLPKASRLGGQRRYEAEVLGRLRMIRLAREAGFTIAETRTFVAGFSPTTPPAVRWRALAQRKLAELEALSERITRMRKLLESSFDCRCLRIEDCERAMSAPRSDAGRSRPAARSQPPLPKRSR